ncbi:MAG TPA: hypothetical protein VGM03_15060 [Phycisphaerae bacterium]|jgi:hypothetical protein
MTRRTNVLAYALAVLLARAADGANIKANIVIGPPANGTTYMVGESVPVSIRLRGETVPINNLSLVQIDFKLTGAVAESIEFAPFGPNDLAGSPSTAFVGTVPSALGGGVIYFWVWGVANPAPVFDLPASDPGRGFVNFTMLLNSPGQVFVNALGPCVGGNGSSSSAFAQLDTTPGTGYHPEYYYKSCEPGAAGNWVQGIPGGPGGGANMDDPGTMITVVPEPGALGMLFVGIALIARGRRT